MGWLGGPSAPALQSAGQEKEPREGIPPANKQVGAQEPGPEPEPEEPEAALAGLIHQCQLQPDQPVIACSLCGDDEMAAGTGESLLHHPCACLRVYQNVLK